MPVFISATVAIFLLTFSQSVFCRSPPFPVPPADNSLICFTLWKQSIAKSHMHKPLKDEKKREIWNKK